MSTWFSLSESPRGDSDISDIPDSFSVAAIAAESLMETPPKRNILFCQLFKIKKQKFSRISESNEYKKIFFYKKWFPPKADEPILYIRFGACPDDYREQLLKSRRNPAKGGQTSPIRKNYIMRIPVFLIS
ncbi:MAG: hypothetical protein US74_C0011G0013 [Parcubacteria group bacterium GW2011_GWA2_38_13]|nr:MAG: hypothetical protein US74_C0011G0013 [Parcubacteria group bacterium GW2011_GWA2_38_13]